MSSIRLALTVVLVGFSAAGAATFTKPPTAEKTPQGVKIEFTASQATDVAVYILDADGKVVRHLVAGQLGKNPPEPLKADSLAQSLIWDGKDNHGQPAPGDAFKVRVTLGTRAEADGFLLENPASTGPVSSLAVGPGGQVYLFHTDATANGNMGGHKLKVIDRDGKPLRTLMPMPSGLSREQTEPLGVFHDNDGRMVPRIHNYQQLNFHPDPVTVRGRSMQVYGTPTVGPDGRVYWMILGPRLVCLDKDGGVPHPTLYSEPLLDVKGLRTANVYHNPFDRTSMVVSTDGKWLYFSGLFTGQGPRGGVSVPAVFRVNLATRAKAEVFLGDVEKGGNGDNQFASPRGLALANGMLYVADHDNNRVMVFKEADKTLLAKIAVDQPDTVGVDPRNGAIYVCSLVNRSEADLIKIDNHTSAKELYRTKLPKAGGAPWESEHRIAVDASADPVMIWLPAVSYGRLDVMRIQDTGKEFTAAEDPRDVKTAWAEGPRDLNVDRQRDLLYVKAGNERWYRINEKTGELADILEPRIGAVTSGTQLVPWRDGNLYTVSWNTGLILLDQAGKRINWPGQQSPLIPLGGIMCFTQRHLEVLSPEEMLLVMNPQWHQEKYDKKPTPMEILFPQGRPGEAARTGLRTSIGVVGPDGRLKRTVIWQCLPGATPRVDPKGNIYLAELVKPIDRSYPEFFDGKLDSPPKQQQIGGDRFWTSYVYGSIIKFPPTGGIVWFGKDLPPNTLGEPPAELMAKPRTKARTHLAGNMYAEVEVQGEKWIRFGFAPYSCYTNGSTSMCMCEGSRFDVDPFGRVFMPNLGQFRVEVIDTNGNDVLTVGQYGNADEGHAQGDTSVPLAWPHAIAASDSHIYIGDTLNRRVAKAKLIFAADQTVEVK